MRQKLFFSLGFLFLAILITAGSCGGTAPKAILSNPLPNPLNLGSGFTGDRLIGSFSITNEGDDTLEYRINHSNGNSKSGTLLPNQEANESLEKLCNEGGNFEENLTITSNGGNRTLKILWKCEEELLSATEYNIQLRLLGNGMTTSRQTVFREAASLWRAVISGDLPDIPVPQGDLPVTDELCGFDTPAFVGTIDDLLIFANIGPIDGVGQILGQAGPAINRFAADGELTAVGCMQFDEADVAALEANGTFNEVILHEMGHVLGIGTFWEPIQFTDGSFFNSRNLLDTPCRSAPGAISKFTGANTVIEFGALGGSGNVPIEDEHGPGTRCGHWDEEFFDNELMTGFLGGVTSSTVNPLSRLTIASLEDLGYEVDYTEAEPYSIPGCSPTCGALRSAEAETPWEVILTPKGFINETGQITFFKDLR